MEMEKDRVSKASAVAFVHGDYERSTSCARSAELIRRTLDGRVTT